jgi:hypothetical protein
MSTEFDWKSLHTDGGIDDEIKQLELTVDDEIKQLELTVDDEIKQLELAEEFREHMGINRERREYALYQISLLGFWPI